MNLFRVVLRVLTGGRRSRVHYECRNCGKNLDANLGECPNCGGPVATYEL